MSPGGPTYQAAQAFARAEGFEQYAPISNSYCERLIERWEQQRSGAPPQDPPNGGSTGIDPRVFRTRYIVSSPSDEATTPPPEDGPLDMTVDLNRTYMKYVGAGVIGLIIVGGLGYYVLTKKKK